MPEHKFNIGATVFYHPKPPSNAPRGAYLIVRRLPQQAGEFHYAIRSIYEDHQRVAKESELSRN
jgi:hypothetical protein